MDFKPGTLVVFTWTGPARGLTTGCTYMVSRRCNDIDTVGMAVVPDDFGYENMATRSCFRRVKKSESKKKLAEFNARVKSLKKINPFSTGWPPLEAARKARDSRKAQQKAARAAAIEEEYRKLNAEPKAHGDGSRWDEL